MSDTTRRDFLRLAMAATPALLTTGGQAYAQASPRKTLTPAELAAVNNCLGIIRGTANVDGALVDMYLGNLPTSPCSVSPYYGCHAACALLLSGLATDRELVRRWLEWLAAKQEFAGHFNDFAGTRQKLVNTGSSPGQDRSMALYLLTLRKFQKAGGVISQKMITAALKAVAGLRGVTEVKTGLTWISPTNQISLLTSNTEVYAGFASGAAFFGTYSNLKVAADECKARAAQVGTALLGYYSPAKSLYGWARYPSAPLAIGLTQFDPEGLANLYGCSFIAYQGKTFEKTTDTFLGNNIYINGYSGADAETYSLAASRIIGNFNLAWRSFTTTTAQAFTRFNVNTFRAGLAVLALYEGADWMPSLSSPFKP